jgi:pyrroline-5-carboxylate reductase
MKIAFIGGGNMAAALIGGLIKRGVAPADLYAIDPNEEASAMSSSSASAPAQPPTPRSPNTTPSCWR